MVAKTKPLFTNRQISPAIGTNCQPPLWLLKGIILLLSCIFSEKVHFENGKAATPKYTPPIEVLINARGVLEGSKNNKEVYKDLLCTLAPSPGPKPGTLRLTVSATKNWLLQD
jgi:hypothetical protein